MAEILLAAVEEVFGEVSEEVRGRCWNGWRRQGSVVELLRKSGSFASALKSKS